MGRSGSSLVCSLYGSTKCFVGLSRILCGTGVMLLCAQFLTVSLNAEILATGYRKYYIIARKFKRLKYCIVVTSDDTPTPPCRVEHGQTCVRVEAECITNKL